MIVNTAYAYMGAAGPADPKLWGDGQVYVPYALADGATFNPSGIYGAYFELPASTSASQNPSVTLTINAKSYTKISCRIAYRSSSSGNMVFEFKKGDTLLGTVNLSVDQYVTTYQVDIPEAARIANVDVVIKKRVVSGTVAILYQPGYML